MSQRCRGRRVPDEANLLVGVGNAGARFGRILQKGRALRKCHLRLKQTEVALAGNPAMLIWLGKQELGQRNIPERGGRTRCRTSDNRVL